MIERILPDGVHWAETFGEHLDEVLFAAEEALVARAVERRRREFRTVRGCAREALAGLGVVPRPALLPTVRGAPGWPDGVVGSMTHCEGYRAAAVASRQLFRAVGIDAEPHAPLPAGVLAEVADAGERSQLAGLASLDGALAWDRIMFSAKESIYKAWSPLTGAWLGFEDVTLTIEPVETAGGTFEATIRSRRTASAAARRPAGRRSGAGRGTPDGAAADPARMAGRWLVDAGLVVTGVTVPAMHR